MAQPAVVSIETPVEVSFVEALREELDSLSKTELQERAGALEIEFKDKDTIASLVGWIVDATPAPEMKIRNPRGTTSDKLLRLVEEFGPDLPCAIPLNVVQEMFCRSARTYTMYWSKHNPGGRASRDVQLDCTLVIRDGEPNHLLVKSFDEPAGEE